MADDDPEVTLVRLNKEEEGVGISAGAHLAGKKSAMLMQNHGLLTSINGIVSLAQLYRIPLLMLISYRGEMGERDPWQTEGGLVTERVLDALGIMYRKMSDPSLVARDIRQAQTLAESSLRPVALLLTRELMWGGLTVSEPLAGPPAMLREDALRAIYPRLKEQVVVTIMGAVAVELYNCGHRPNFFYLEHGMGLASSMGLGLALSLPHRQVTVLDGDASLLMNLGTLSTMARYRPPNLTHIVFDNESLLSVGGLPLGHRHRHRPGRHRPRSRRRIRGAGRHRGSPGRSLRRRHRARGPVGHPLQGRSRRPRVLRHGHWPAGKTASSSPGICKDAELWRPGGKQFVRQSLHRCDNALCVMRRFCQSLVYPVIQESIQLG